MILDPITSSSDLLSQLLIYSESKNALTNESFNYPRRRSADAPDSRNDKYYTGLSGYLGRNAPAAYLLFHCIPHGRSIHTVLIIDIGIINLLVILLFWKETLTVVLTRVCFADQLMFKFFKIPT